MYVSKTNLKPGYKTVAKRTTKKLEAINPMQKTMHNYHNIGSNGLNSAQHNKNVLKNMPSYSNVLEFAGANGYDATSDDPN